MCKQNLDQSVVWCQIGEDTFSTKGSLDGDAFQIVCGDTKHKGTLVVQDDTVNMFFSSGKFFSAGVLLCSE